MAERRQYKRQFTARTATKTPARTLTLALWLAFVFLQMSVAVPVVAQVAFEQPPIDYLKAVPQDAIARLQSHLDRDEIKLQFDRQHGYLASVLAQLGV